MAVKKIIGWGKNSTKETVGNNTTTYNDIAINSTSLSVEEGDEQEAQIEGGEAEARKKNPDKYILEAERRIDDPSEVNDVLGFTEEVDSIEVIPQEVGAVGVTLINPSRHVTVSYDTSDGLKAKYTYKTKGATNSAGKLTDISFTKKVAGGTYSAVSTSSDGYSTKNPKALGWFIKNGNVYIPALDTTPVEGVTYYTLS
jgi:hypothetical protein